jgi:hypothetical protein
LRFERRNSSSQTDLAPRLSQLRHSKGFVMATIRKRGAKWQVQIRRVGVRPISRSFHVLKDAEAWARQMELVADRRDLPPDPKALQRITLGQLVERYLGTVSVRKRGYHVEVIRGLEIVSTVSRMSTASDVAGSVPQA